MVELYFMQYLPQERNNPGQTRRKQVKKNVDLFMKMNSMKKQGTLLKII
uniref:Alternative protein SLC17A6 n=1 Tax=Homo sapiens TaxID=9606 RepID=L8ECI6_HUMAN|nr:alternative protein SLC17A6 [Homo sapiens]